MYNLKTCLNLLHYLKLIKNIKGIVMRQTTLVKHKEVTKKWYVIDAAGQVLGRVATLAASHLRGKTSPTFTPNVDMGDNIIIINADRVVLTAKKKNKNLLLTLRILAD